MLCTESRNVILHSIVRSDRQFIYVSIVAALEKFILLDVRSLAIASRASQFPSGALSGRVKV